MNKLQAVLTKNKEAGKKSFIGYFTAGDPSIDAFERTLLSLEKAGCDVIELGVPFSDPLADGPTIQAAGQRAIEGGINIEKVFDLVAKHRHQVKAPLVFLIYFNTIYRYGMEAFAKRCEETGIDGLIIPDLPLEEQDEFLPYIDQSKIAMIPFATPTSKGRLNKVLANGSGFVYTVSSMGVTGRNSEFYADIEKYVEEVREAAKDIPVAIGFGISTASDVKRISKIADAVIVGSAIVTKIHETNADPKAVEAFIKELKAGLEE